MWPLSDLRLYLDIRVVIVLQSAPYGLAVWCTMQVVRRILRPAQSSPLT
jgi:hypothetical protein